MKLSKNHRLFLKFFMIATNDQCTALLKWATNQQLQVAVELILNGLHHNIHLKKKEIRKLQTHQQLLRRVDNPELPRLRRKALIVKVGEILKIFIRGYFRDESRDGSGSGGQIQISD